MKVVNSIDIPPKSSFLSIEKNYALIFEKIMHNQRLLKMLYYTQPDCLSAPNLTKEQIYSMPGKQLKIIPKVELDNNTCPNYILIYISNFSRNYRNPEFRDAILTFDIVCAFDHWNMGDFQLRPYKIAGEIDSMIDKKKLIGIGEANFFSASNLLIGADSGGVSLKYTVIHSIEDKLIEDNE